MSYLINVRAIAAASAFAAISAMAFVAQTGTASAKSVTSCEGGSRSSVVNCCEDIAQRKGLPVWMRNNHARCDEVVKCKYGTFAGANRYCWVSILTIDDSNGNKTPKGRSPNTRN